MKLSAKTGVELTITALSLVVTVGASASDSVTPVVARVISCCTAYSEEVPVPSTPVTPVVARVISCCTAYSEEAFVVRLLSTSAAHVDMMNQLRNLTEPNAIAWGWSHGLANDEASAGMTQ